MPAASVTELSLGPPQGSLGVIMEEGSKEAGSEADEGHSAPQADSRMASAAQDLATRGKKRRETSSCLVSGDWQAAYWRFAGLLRWPGQI